jgi:hypothetical protein
MNYLSFSLWGDKPIYNIGTIKNAELWKTIYPEWQMVVYYDSTVPQTIVDQLKNMSVKVINMTGIPYGCMWRFLAIDIPDSEYIIIRDSDSRISDRESLAVNEWISNGDTLHVMRDHPSHHIPYGANGLGILAGMWGMKHGKINITKMVNEFIKDKSDYYGIDQKFLQNIYSLFINDRTIHDEFFEKKPFPISRKNGRFIGERINVNEEPLTEDYKLVLNK